MKRLTAIVIALHSCRPCWTGCASTPQSHFYTLSPASKPAAAAAASYSISVGPVTVPAAVDRPQIVVRVGPNQVDIDEFNRWASPLQSDIATGRRREPRFDARDAGRDTCFRKRRPPAHRIAS